MTENGKAGPLCYVDKADGKGTRLANGTQLIRTKKIRRNMESACRVPHKTESVLCVAIGWRSDWPLLSYLPASEVKQAVPVIKIIHSNLHVWPLRQTSRAQHL